MKSSSFLSEFCSHCLIMILWLPFSPGQKSCKVKGNFLIRKKQMSVNVFEKSKWLQEIRKLFPFSSQNFLRYLIGICTWLLYLATMKDLVSEEGITTLFRGAGSTIQCVAASNFIYFYTFHGLKKWLSRDTPSALTDLLFACVAGEN